MKRFGTLFRAGLKANFGLSMFYHRFFREKKDLWGVPLFALSLLGIGTLLYGGVGFIRDLYFVLKPISQENLLLTIGLMSGQVLILIFGLYYVIAAFYFSRDLEMLVPLPVRPCEVLASKFAVIIVNEYLTAAIIVLPFVITFGLLDKAGPGYWVNAILVYMALPIIPLVILTVIVVAMMRFINISRKKDILVVVGGVAVLAAVAGFQYLVLRTGNTAGKPEEIAALLSAPDSLINKVGSLFPPAIWATKAITGGFSGGLLNLAIFLGVSLLLFIAMIVLVEQLYYKGVIGLAETSGPKKKLTGDEMSRRVSSGRRAVFAIFMREVRIMNRTPPFLLNGVLTVFLFPAIIVLLIKTNPDGGDAALRMLSASDNSMIILIMTLFMVVCGCLNGTSSSTFSREGSQFWISRTIPVSPGEQVAAKFLHSYLITLLGIVTVLVASIVLFPFRPLYLLSAAGLAIIVGFTLVAAGMIVDLARPLLDWTNPQKAMKQNLNVLIAMFLDAGILAAAFFGVRAMIKAGAAINFIIGILYAAFAILSALTYLGLLKFADMRYREIEN